jgi:hypothetical protein
LRPVCGKITGFFIRNSDGNGSGEAFISRIKPGAPECCFIQASAGKLIGILLMRGLCTKEAACFAGMQ